MHIVTAPGALAGYAYFISTKRTYEKTRPLVTPGYILIDVHGNNAFNCI